jgi:hypothetical protein
MGDAEDQIGGAKSMRERCSVRDLIYHHPDFGCACGWECGLKEGETLLQHLKIYGPKHCRDYPQSDVGVFRLMDRLIGRDPQALVAASGTSR